ncbi:unnamed protein product [Mortierella alpina]
MAAFLDHALPVVCTVRVVYAYMAREEGDLTLNKGDIIRVHDNDGGWWKGSLLPDYIYGSFPSNFVEILHEHSTQESTLTSPRPQSRQRQHSRQSSVDSSKFTKRKPVNTQLAKHNAPSSTSLPYRGSTNCSSVSLGRQILAVSSGRRQSTKSEGAAPGDDGLDKQSRAKTSASQGASLPGAYPFASSESQSEAARVTNEAVYNPTYAEQHGNPSNHKSNLLNPSGPDGSLAAAQEGAGRHLSNRFSMPNLAGDALTQQQHQQQQQQQLHSPQQRQQRGPRHSGTSGSSMGLAPGQLYLQDTVGHGPRGATGTQSAYHLPRGNMSGLSLGGYEAGSQSSMQSSYHGQHRPEEMQHHHQHGMMPRSSTEYYSQQFVSHGVAHPMQQASYGHVSDASQQFAQQQQQQQQGYRHSIANFGAQSYVQQSNTTPGHYPIQHSQLSLENLAKHNRSQSALDTPKSHSNHGAAHGRSVSQVNLRPQGSAVFNPYDHQQQPQQHHQQQQLQQQLQQEQQQLQRQQQQHQQQQRAYSASMHRLSMGPLRTPSPSIVIPQPKGRPQSAFANYASCPMTPTENSPTSAGTSTTFGTPQTPNTVQSKRAGTPTSAGTHMSEVSTSSAKEQRRKSETARMPPSASMTASNFTTRKFSVDSKTLLTTGSTSASTAAISSATARASMGGHENGISEDAPDGVIDLGTYTAKKPKTTLIRAFKQIINPKKVAQKDALKNKNEHFAWIEMQKSLKRVPSPEPGQERSHFAVTTSTTSAAAAALASGDVAVEEFLQQSQEDQDPFSILRRSHVMCDHPAAASMPAAAGGVLDFGPNAFVQVDKVARNVNQRGPHMTPQLLSQKYLTRPYSKAPLSKLRVLFVWVSENIRLEGGTTRDVSGGRYKLGPVGEHPSTSLTAAAAAGIGSESPTIRSGACTPPPSVFMAGVEEYARGFLQEGTPELAQEVLTSRTSKTGEGFANLFAEMALAAGIEDVGVVKGYVKGPMDVFSKDVPASNHAWNVVRIDGTYRFIDCCLASPLHPAHYPNRPQTASSFYFLTQPMDLVLTHHPVFLTYQYITPSIPPHIFLQLPFVRPAYFDFGLSLPDFRRRTRLDVTDYEPIEIVVRIDGHGGLGGGVAGGVHLRECLGKGCGEGVELRAEIEVMTSEGKIIRKRGLAQVMIWNPYQQPLQQPSPSSSAMQQQQQQQQQQGPASSSLSVGGTSSAVTVASIATASNRPLQSHHCTGIRVAKIKAVLPNETVVGPGGVRKGIVHIYAGRKVENAPGDATPYSLALSLPVRHTGAMPKTPFSFVLPHFSPYEFYVKTPQSELLYYPHTYKFCIVSLAAQAQAVAACGAAMALAESNSEAAGVGSSLTGPGGPHHLHHAHHGTMMSSTRHVKALTTGGHATSGSTASMTPMYRPQPNAQTLRGHYGGVVSASASLQTLAGPGSGSGGGAGGGGGGGGGGLKHSPYLHQHHPYQMNSSTSMASTSSMSVNGGVYSHGHLNGLGGGGSSCTGYGHGMSIPRPERLVLRTQTNRLYKLVYDPVRQCHEAQVEVKERGIWECVRMDDGGKSRVGREGTGGVVIASWKCV